MSNDRLDIIDRIYLNKLNLKDLETHKTGRAGHMREKPRKLMQQLKDQIAKDEKLLKEIEEREGY